MKRGPLFDLEVYARRRARLLEQMEEAVVLLTAAPPRIKSHDTEYPYRPSSDILYLTGFTEPHSAVVLQTGAAGSAFVLFVQDRDPEKERWQGDRLGVEEAAVLYGADEVHPISRLKEELGRLLAGKRHLYYQLNLDREMDQTLFGALDQLRGTRVKPDRAPNGILDPRRLLHDLRRIKGPEEIEIMRQAAALGAEAHRVAMRSSRPGQMEYEVAAGFQYLFQRRGAVGTSFDTIVGGGDNATVLHYSRNDCRLAEGDLVLIDAGAELHYYASDITRTFPVGRSFSPAQRDVYQAVLEVQKGVVAQVRPGASIHELNRWARRALTQAMVDLGLLTGEVDSLVEQEAYRPYYMHGIGHYLGLDTHDVGTYLIEEEKPMALEPGVVFTVEPGLYIPKESEQPPPHLRGIGVRIEDDLLVTPSGGEVLTGQVPKEIDEIEALRREALA